MGPLLIVALVVAINVASYLLMPKPKQPKPPAVQDLEAPTADAGRPMPVPFGTITIKSANVLWYGEISKYSYEIKV